jgi:galactose-1-phosphate uridylyltransferase
LKDKVLFSDAARSGVPKNNNPEELMVFKKVLKKATFLDPLNGFNPGGRECEIRTDPLTGRNTRVLFFPVRVLPEPDLDVLKSKDTGFCPFCVGNIDKITPKFNPELFTKERYRVGEAVCFPNAFPYDENGAVTVMTEKHMVLIDEFTPEIIKDAVTCCVEFLNDVTARQHEAVYQSINWNYLPVAGSSIVHPHLQITASSVPTNYYSDVLKTMDISPGNVFSDLVDSEVSADERFISKGDFFSWLIAFAPEGVFDLMAVSHEYFTPADLKEGRLAELVGGILKTINFIKKYNIISYNMSLFFLRGNDEFKPHMRLCPRTNVPPLDTSEINYMKMLHNEPMTTMRPELVAEEIKKIWGACN